MATHVEAPPYSQVLELQAKMQVFTGLRRSRQDRIRTFDSLPPALSSRHDIAPFTSSRLSDGNPR